MLPRGNGVNQENGTVMNNVKRTTTEHGTNSLTWEETCHKYTMPYNFKGIKEWFDADLADLAANDMSGKVNALDAYQAAIEEAEGYIERNLPDGAYGTAKLIEFIAKDLLATVVFVL